MTRLKVPASIYGLDPKLYTLVMVSDEELVWTVEKTRCPVMADSIAISNVS